MIRIYFAIARLAGLVMLAYLTTCGAHAQCTTPTTPDVWIWNYSGDEHRGGVLALYESDYVQGSALTSNGIPLPPLYSNLPPCTWTTPPYRQIGGLLTLDNITPECNGVTYVLANFQTSSRSDGAYDHIEQDGLAWGSNPGDVKEPALQDQTEAGSLKGTEGNYTNWGDPFVFRELIGYCLGQYAI